MVVGLERIGKPIRMLFVGLIGFFAVAFISLVWLAPHALTLISEGYPTQKWPSGGEFLLVDGDETGIVAKRNKLDNPTFLIFTDPAFRALLWGRGADDVFELYARQDGPKTRFNSFSLVKGLVGVLALKAVDEGVIASLDSTVGEIEPSLKGLVVATVTLRELIDMRSGISFEAIGLKSASGGDANGQKTLEAMPYNPFGPMARLHALGIEKLIGEFKVSPVRRGQFEYQNANTAIVGYLLEKAYEKPLAMLLSETIWKPAGAQSAQWRKYPQTNFPTAYCCLYATAADWRRVASYLLSNGTPGKPLLSVQMWQYWKGTDILAEQRQRGVYRSFARYDILDRPGEPLQGPFLYFLGQNGQIVYFLPERNAVAVRFGDRMHLLHTGLYDLARWL